MAGNSQRKATRAYRKRNRGAGLVRVEVQARREHSELIKTVAKTLREDPAAAFEVRKALADSEKPSGGQPPPGMSLYDLFAQLPKAPAEAFEGVFDQPRDTDDREIDL